MAYVRVIIKLSVLTNGDVSQRDIYGSVCFNFFVGGFSENLAVGRI
jgi:hypothetical protein